VIVAVVAVLVVKVAGDAIIHMVAVRHCLMAAARPVHMARLMPTAAMVGGAAFRIVAGNLDHMLVDMAFVRVMSRGTINEPAQYRTGMHFVSKVFPLAQPMEIHKRFSLRLV
jgi:hypothetical protein